MDITRKVIRKLKEAKDRDICLWLIPRKDGTVSKVRFSFSHACVLGATAAFIATGAVYIGRDYSRFVSARDKIESLFNEAKGGDAEDQIISLDYHESLLSQIKFLTDEHYKSKAYESQVRNRLSALKAALESELPLDVLQEDPSLINSKKDVGGAEVDCKPGALDCIPNQDEKRAAFSWNFGRLFSGSEPEEKADLLASIEGYLKLLEKLPISRPVAGWVTSGFGVRKSPFTGRLSKHQGIDFSLPNNSSIVATADGIVKSVVRTRTYGLMVEIQHNKRVTTRYAHLNKAVIKPGDHVCRGEVIAISGSTGRSTGPHLHYEVRVDKKPVDPKKFLAVGASLSPGLLEIK